jgi:ADP-heptose:LPS heptosyltransferase
MGLNLPDELLKPIQKPKDDILKMCKNILSLKVNDKFVLVQMRASSPIRTPAPDVWRKVINFITEKYPVVINDAPQQFESIRSFIKTLKNPDKVFNFSEYSKDIDFAIALASTAEITVSPDSSLVHVANSLGIKNIGIYGPFPGKIRLETYDQNICKWVDCKAMCAPCFTHGHKPCYNSELGYSKCFKNLDMDEFEVKFKELTGE